MILTCLEPVKLLSLATHPLPDKLLQEKQVYCYCYSRIQHYIALQGQHEVDLFLIQAHTDFLRCKLHIKPSDHRQGIQFSKRTCFKLLNITASLSSQEWFLPWKTYESNSDYNLLVNNSSETLYRLKILGQNYILFL